MKMVFENISTTYLLLLTLGVGVGNEYWMMKIFRVWTPHLCINVNFLPIFLTNQTRFLFSTWCVQLLEETSNYHAQKVVIWKEVLNLSRSSQMIILIPEFHIYKYLTRNDNNINDWINPEATFYYFYNYMYWIWTVFV